MLQVSQKSLYAHLFPYVCVYRENTIKRELEVALMCPSFTADFIALKGGNSRLDLPHFHSFNILGCHLSCQSTTYPCLVWSFAPRFPKLLRKMATVNRRSQQNTLQQPQQKQDSVVLCAFWSLFCDYCGILNIVSCGNFWVTLLQSHDSKPVTRGEP